MKKNLILPILLLCASFSALNAQIKVYSNGTVHIGNTTSPLFDANTRFEVNAQKAVIKCTTSILGGREIRGFQFIPSNDEIPAPSIGSLLTSVAALTGLSDGEASIGTRNNNMHIIYSKYYYSSGNYIGTLASSDANLKTNIRELSSKSERRLAQSSVSDRVFKLRPVTYDFVKTATGEDVSKNLAYKNRTGFIAQEVAELFPDLVAVDSRGLYSLDYTGLIPYLTQTIKEQNERIEKLEKQIYEGVSPYFDITVDAQNSRKNISDKDNLLHQNTPNPFTSSTTIAYQLAEDIRNAKICIYNLVGKQLQCHELPANKGENKIEVRASSLQAGMYLYSLLVDGRLVDTKRMILTE